MTADDIKRLLYRDAEKHWKVRLAVDEAGVLSGNSDFLIVDWRGYTREIEIKVSGYDLAELEPKKQKWRLYFSPFRDHYIENLPNYFYFCITEEIYQKYREFIIEKWEFAGIIVATKDGIEIKKKPQKLHNNKLNEKRYVNIARYLYLKYKNTQADELQGTLL